MKSKILMAILLFSAICKAQNGEFKTYDNGLIYSEKAVDKLKHIVDSLNLKFKVCDINKVYYSVNQTNGHYIEIEGKKSFDAKKDIENNISYTDFVTKYPKAIKDENLTIIKGNYIDYQNIKVNYFESLEIGKSNRNQFSIQENKTNSDEDNVVKIIGNWIFRYSKKTNYSKESIEAFYFPNKFESKPLPAKYNKLIQYSECLIDTNSDVFYKDAKESGVRYYDSIPNKARKFTEYVEKVLKKPDFSMEKFMEIMDLEGNSIVDALGEKSKKLAKNKN